MNETTSAETNVTQKKENVNLLICAAGYQWFWSLTFTALLCYRCIVYFSSLSTCYPSAPIGVCAPFTENNKLASLVKADEFSWEASQSKHGKSLKEGRKEGRDTGGFDHLEVRCCYKFVCVCACVLQIVRDSEEEQGESVHYSINPYWPQRHRKLLTVEACHIMLLLLTPAVVCCIQLRSNVKYPAVYVRARVFVGGCVHARLCVCFFLILSYSLTQTLASIHTWPLYLSLHPHI